MIGPTTANFSFNSSFGSHTARPIAPGGNPIFISRDRRRLIMISYSFEADANRPLILSRASQHMGNERFEQVVWQAAPEPMAWIRRANGDVAVMIFDQAEEVLGWATVPLAGGFCEALAVTPNFNGTTDEVMMIVRRRVNGVNVRFVERMAPIFSLLYGTTTIKDACHLFAVSSFASEPASPANTPFDVSHLIGEAVYVWTDNGSFGPITVPPDGTITLPVAVARAYIGLFDETHYVETLDVQAAAGDGNTLGRKSGCMRSSGSDFTIPPRATSRL